MKFRINKSALLAAFFVCFQLAAHAAIRTASIKINDKVKYQKITGFGGFVNSPQFGYNHMSTTEIRKIWGKSSETGYNIMRMYLPSSESSWSQTLETAKLAKSLGLILFASPWSMPAEWKTNNHIAAVYTDANGIKQEGSLKEEYYDDYALYLNRFVTYLQTNGVKLDAISIQNEPDMKVEYAGCLWTPTQMANFIKNYGHLINCKIMAAEGVGITDNYATALTPDSVSSQFDIFAGHQYSYIQSGMKNLQAKGKEVWMTEYLINWNADATTPRNFSWSNDGLNFASKLNDALLANVNAWVHYASKRFYGLMGDGTYGTVTGAITKRGYIQSHYAKYATGATRIEHVWSDESSKLSGSSYVSVSGDSVIVMVINPSADSYSLTVDLPFYTQSNSVVTTSASLNMSKSTLTLSEETFRPKVSVGASSLTTFIFSKSSVRPESKMVGQAFHPSKIDQMTVSNAAFGTSYKLSGKTVTFDHLNALISANTTSASGYLRLDDHYTQLVFRVNKVTSTMSFSSSNTTLYYINSLGSVNSYNYGSVSFNSSGNYEWSLDISRKVLTDGCIGVLGISNSNYSSILSLTLGDVYFKKGTEKLFKFTGVYSNGDSNLMDCLEDSSYTSLDFTGADSLTSDKDWRSISANKNCLFYTSSSVTNSRDNVVTGSTCAKLNLVDGSVNFYVPVGFTATNASYNKVIEGFELLVLPFAAAIPEGVKVYTIQSTPTEVTCTPLINTVIPANTPVLVEANGTFAFVGSGAVSTPKAMKVGNFYGVYISSFAPAGSYTLKTVGGSAAFYKVTSGTEPNIDSFQAYMFYSTTNALSSVPLRFIPTDLKMNRLNSGSYDPNKPIYDLFGRSVSRPVKGVYIQDGKKIMF